MTKNPRKSKVQVLIYKDNQLGLREMVSIILREQE